MQTFLCLITGSIISCTIVVVINMLWKKKIIFTENGYRLPRYIKGDELQIIQGCICSLICGIYCTIFYQHYNLFSLISELIMQLALDPVLYLSVVFNIHSTPTRLSLLPHLVNKVNESHRLRILCGMDNQVMAQQGMFEHESLYSNGFII